jgi:hypothetical protein
MRTASAPTLRNTTWTMMAAKYVKAVRLLCRSRIGNKRTALAMSTAVLRSIKKAPRASNDCNGAIVLRKAEPPTSEATMDEPLP